MHIIFVIIYLNPHGIVNFTYNVLVMNVKDAMINVKRIRLAKNWKQKYLADELNVTEATYGRYESGDINMKLEHFLMIANLFEMTLDEIAEFNPDNPGGSNPKKEFEKQMADYEKLFTEKEHKIAMLNEKQFALKRENKLLIENLEAKKTIVQLLKEKAGEQNSPTFGARTV